MVEDVIQRQQTGAKVRLYIDRQMSGANVDQKTQVDQFWQILFLLLQVSM